MSKSDVERHISKPMHKANMEALHSQQKLTFLAVSNPVNDKVKIAMHVSYIATLCLLCVSIRCRSYVQKLR